MKQMLDLPGSYDKSKNDWLEGVKEFSNFFLNNLSNQYFLDFLRTRFGITEKQDPSSEIDSSELVWRKKWDERLEKLSEKATHRLGHKIDLQKLEKEALARIINLEKNGELPPSKYLNHFCEEFSDDQADAC